MKNFRNNTTSRHNNHQYHRGANYVWRVEWYPANSFCNKKYKSFTNKQRALIFKTSIESRGAWGVYLEKYTG